MTPIARRVFDEEGSIKNTHGEYLAAVSDISKSLDVMLIDMFELTAKYVTELGPENSKKVYLWLEPNDTFPEGKKDNTHLSTMGAHEFAKLVLNDIIDRDITFASHIRKRMLN